MRIAITAVVLGLALEALPAAAQPAVSGNMTVGAALFPSREQTTEARTRLFVDSKLDPSPNVRFELSGFAEGLVARRPDGLTRSTHQVTDAVLNLTDATIDVKTHRMDLLAGFGRTSWGRLDELQPTDVVNPLDASRFFFESRSEARLPVGLIRVRAYLSDDTSVEAIYVPFFRRGRFDQLDEPSSPFNIQARLADSAVVCLALDCPARLPIALERHEPPASWRSAQGGARFNTTTGIVDWSVSAYRGFEPFGFGTIGPPDSIGLKVHIVHPRFTMIGGDFETVRGEWGLRGEAAVFVEDHFQTAAPGIASGTAFDAGLGLDRTAGAYRVSGTALYHRENYDRAVVSAAGEASGGRSDLSVTVAADRTFSRERYRFRTFAVYTPDESTAFLRAIGIANLRDNVAFEASAGWFGGSGPDLIGRFSDSDFVYVRLKYYF